jgi:hypothetical protein
MHFSSLSINLNTIKKTRKNCFRYLKLMSSLNAAICTTISYTLWVEWYYLKNNYFILRSKVKVPRRSLWYATHHLMVMHPHTKYHWSISKDKNVMARTRKYYLKNNYLTLRSKSRKGANGLLLLCLPFERRETYCFSLIFSSLPLILFLLSEACPDHNFFVFPDRSIIFGMWVHDHKAVCRVP